MITYTVRYEIDPDKLAESETYAKAWLHLVPKPGGTHHGYHLPHEGPNDIAYCHFPFDSLAACEAYREMMWADPDGLRAYAHATPTRCIRRDDSSFTRHLTEGATVDELGL